MPGLSMLEGGERIASPSVVAAVVVSNATTKGSRPEHKNTWDGVLER